MAPDSVSAVGGATAPADTTAATTTTAASRTRPAAGGDAFGDALKVAKGAASTPTPTAGAPSAQALARAKELGLAGGAAAYDVLGHRYARVEGGSHDGRYVNTSGNTRNGQTFEIVQRGGHTYHVYEDRAVRVGAKAPEAAPASAPAPAPSAGGSAAA
ncbi:hypothetical protein LRS13_22630 [Svornostia abyssi]|uniref:Uncharacterized protein n=1 Tax=Svornostia abyssi TaxID=2898438 RepID=A0ABY5PFU8_9ACTN|nr:hypothetical protein LRS13_22630 [Parviterribacteraceae bacterium J379]